MLLPMFMHRRLTAAILLGLVVLQISMSGAMTSPQHSEIRDEESKFLSSVNILNESEGEIVVVTVDGTNLRFTPDTITLKEGDSVHFFWSDELLAHNAVEENGLFDSGDTSRNVDYTYTFKIGENGTYQYVCEPHESLGMVGTIIVEPMPVPEPEPEPEPTTDDDKSSTLSVGEGDISSILFAPWLVAMFVLVGYISLRTDEYQLRLVLEAEEVEDVVEEEETETGNTLEESYRSRVLTLCALYVAQGIPWGFITVTFVTYLAAEGVAAKELAFLLTLGTLPWSLKFLWGPVIDRYQYRQMGRRRPWILIAQSGMILVLSTILLIPNPASDVQLIATIFLIYNIFTSLQDVSTDALAVDILKPHEIEKVNSYMFTSKTLGGMIGGAGLGTIIGIVGIKGAILLQIPILLVIMMVPLLMTERPGEKRFPWDENQITEDEESLQNDRDFSEIIANVKTAFSLKSTRLGIVLSLVLSLSFFLIPVLPLLFINELDWSEERFNATKGGLILIITMLGYIVGGQLGKKFGGKAVIIYSALGGALLTTTWGLTENWWSNDLFMISIWSIRTFVFAMVSMNIFSLMMKITWSEVGGTQFTAYMAMMNLSAIIGYQLTDPIASRFDYPTLFLIAAVLETLIIIATMFIDPDETRRTLSA
ncbi:MAG: MFS transporter [Candidatus Poseidoniales archaeon]|nr:MAG: MFS transporter [Candidatus Poseidoniales archaeon]